MECNLYKEGRLKQNILIVVAGCLLLIATPTWAWEPWSYSAEPIEGRVLDKETGQPIEGAVVVAQWILIKGLHPGRNGRINVIEVITDAEGRYRIPGWGPKRRPWFTWLEDYDPTLVVFKPGYWPKFLTNKNPASLCIICKFNEPGSKLRKAFWNGKDISLWPFRIGEEIKRDDLITIYSDEKPLSPNPTELLSITEAKWAEQISNVQGNVDWGRWTGKREEWTKEDWLNIKNLVRAIHEECLKLPEKLRFKAQRLPDEIRNILLGDLPPCPGGF